MCCTSENSQEIGTEKKFRLADFFDRHWDAYMEVSVRSCTSMKIQLGNRNLH